MKLDMHCHTKEGSLDGKLPLEDAINLLLEKGYQGMLITDHNSYQGYRNYKRHQQEIQQRLPQDFVVLKGIEYDTIDAGHIIVIMPTGVKLPLLELRGLPVNLLIDIVHHFGGILGPAHPCGEKYLSLLHTKKGKKYQDFISRFDFIETFNACESPASNQAAADLAARFHKPGIGGSDFHREDCAGMGYTLIEAHIKNETDFIQAVTAGVPITSGGDYYLHTTKQKIGRMNNLLIYSFWVYNKVSALHRRRRRKKNLKEYHLLTDQLSKESSHTKSRLP